MSENKIDRQTLKFAALRNQLIKAMDYIAELEATITELNLKLKEYENKSTSEK
jgi:hypothetical protein